MFTYEKDKLLGWEYFEAFVPNCFWLNSENLRYVIHSFLYLWYRCFYALQGVKSDVRTSSGMFVNSEERKSPVIQVCLLLYCRFLTTKIWNVSVIYKCSTYWPFDLLVLEKRTLEWFKTFVCFAQNGICSVFLFVVLC